MRGEVLDVVYAVNVRHSVCSECYMWWCTYTRSFSPSGLMPFLTFSHCSKISLGAVRQSHIHRQPRRYIRNTPGHFWLQLKQDRQEQVTGCSAHYFLSNQQLISRKPVIWLFTSTLSQTQTQTGSQSITKKVADNSKIIIPLVTNWLLVIDKTVILQ